MVGRAVVGRSVVGRSVAGAATRGRGARRGVWVCVPPGRTIFGASGIGIVDADDASCPAGLPNPSRPRTGAACGVCAAAGIAAVLITVMAASKAASPPRSVFIVENPLRALVAALSAGEAEPTATATRVATRWSDAAVSCLCLKLGDMKPRMRRNATGSESSHAPSDFSAACR